MKLYMIQRDEFYELCWLQFIVFIHFVPLRNVWSVVDVDDDDGNEGELKK